MSNAIERILAQGRENAAGETIEGKFYGSLVGNNLEPKYFEARFKDGTLFSLKYEELNWFFYYPSQNCIELNFGSTGIGLRIIGRGLNEGLYAAIQQRRVLWIREADTEWEDNKENETFIQEIQVDYGEAETQAE